jgi:aspartokinase-like uncharacterized kinase
MALSTTELAEIEAVLDTEAEPARVVADLRRRFPALTVTQCDPSDLDNETPFRAWSRFSLYLVDSADHCWRLTSDAARATGLVVVAQKASA